jgi:hypothetical protein
VVSRRPSKDIISDPSPIATHPSSPPQKPQLKKQKPTQQKQQQQQQQKDFELKGNPQTLNPYNRSCYYAKSSASPRSNEELILPQK